MFRYGTVLPALALAGVLGLLFGPEARAQTADDVACNKCVEKRDIARSAVVRSRIKNNAVNGRKIKDGAVSESKLSFDVATQEELDDLTLDQAGILAHLLPKTVFVTSSDFTGNLGGLPGADAICQAAADDPAAIVPIGTYVAWLSTATTDARDRITQTLGPYVRSDGRVVAKTYADLINALSTPLLSTINPNEFGTNVNETVWTGTNEFGISVPNRNCAGWTSGSAADDGVIGITQETGADWTSLVDTSCGTTNHFYCFQK